MLHLLLQTDLNEEQKDYGETMQRSADSLLRIIDDVLDFRYFNSLNLIIIMVSYNRNTAKYKRVSWN